MCRIAWCRAGRRRRARPRPTCGVSCAGPRDPGHRRRCSARPSRFSAVCSSSQTHSARIPLRSSIALWERADAHVRQCRRRASIFSPTRTTTHTTTHKNKKLLFTHLNSAQRGSSFLRRQCFFQDHPANGRPWRPVISIHFVFNTRLLSRCPSIHRDSTTVRQLSAEKKPQKKTRFRFLTPRAHLGLSTQDIFSLTLNKHRCQPQATAGHTIAPATLSGCLNGEKKTPPEVELFNQNHNGVLYTHNVPSSEPEITRDALGVQATHQTLSVCSEKTCNG